MMNKIFLAIKTDNPITEIYLIHRESEIAKEVWESGNKLSLQILDKLEELLTRSGHKKSEMGGIVVFEGPGSFTGLRIGTSVANALAYSYQIPIVGTSGNNWIQDGLLKLRKAKISIYVSPKYGRDPHVTKPKK